jgi:hypothetical protein
MRRFLEEDIRKLPALVERIRQAASAQDAPQAAPEPEQLKLL